jgi:hypothetical protein
MSDKVFSRILKLINKLIPGDWLKTFVFLNCLATPRRVLRKSIGGFYRMEHIYEVLNEFNKHYVGKFSILEFGVADGYSFTKKLYATHYLKMTDKVIVHGFDTFKGLPKVTDSAEHGLVGQEWWVEGHFKGRYEELENYCSRKYNNFKLHKGLFENTITDEFLKTLEEYLPILIWIDCDYYTSTNTVFEKLIPYIPTGCVVYFDDIYYNFSSRFTGEMRAVWEINQGLLGKEIELVLDPSLTLDSDRVYRFINLKSKVKHQMKKSAPAKGSERPRKGDSPFP